jgi:hypothetical protein
LPQYTEHLRQQPALAQLPWERVPAVLHEATDWGLLSPHPDAPELFLRLQPVLPYFLRSRGQTVEHAEVWGRPPALAVATDGSLLVADDTGGTIWKVRYMGAAPASAADGQDQK